MTLLRTNSQIWLDTGDFIAYPWCDGDVIVMPVSELYMTSHTNLRCVPTDTQHIDLTLMFSLRLLSEYETFKISSHLCKPVVDVLKPSRYKGVVNLTPSQAHSVMAMWDAINAIMY